MRRAMTLGLVLAAGLGGGCAEFGEECEPDHSAEYRRGEVRRDDRSADKPAADGPGVYPDR